MINISPSTTSERRLLFLETLLNTAVNEDGTSKVSKVSKHSVLSGIAGGVARVAGKAEKDIALGISQLFPDHAYGEQLDVVAENFGVGKRYNSLGSSTFIRLDGDPGTTYQQSSTQFTANNGVRFVLEEDVEIPDVGFTYVKVRSMDMGIKSNVEPLSINKCNPQPTGHKSCINEYMATGGRDVEDDIAFRARIKDSFNFLSKGTLSSLEQVMIKINPNILRLWNLGISLNGKNTIGVVTQNGSQLNQQELRELQEGVKNHLNLSDLSPSGSDFIGVEVVNMDVFPIDISFRVDISSNYSADEVRKEIQIALAKYLDIRYFDSSRQKVEWDRMLQICQSIEGVKYVPDQYFYPRIDLTVDSHAVPRLRSFLMLDLQGRVISNFQGTLNPVYYPNVVDFSYHRTILESIV